MSKWTGKCDFCDSCEMIHNPQEIIEKSKIYLGDSRVMIKEERDLIPYYTHLISSACYNKEKGNVIYLSEESFIDSEEKDCLAWKIRDVILGFRKAKKEKTEFTLDYLKKQRFWWNDSNVTVWKALIDRVKNNTDIIKNHLPKDYRDNHFITEWLIPNYFNDIHDSMHNRYRIEFVEFLKRNKYLVFSDEIDYESEYHPIAWKMCRSIEEYNKMNEKYGGNI